MMRSISFSLVIWVFTLLPLYAQTGFNGTFLAVVDGMSCRLATKTAYNVISGTYDEGGLRLQVIGTFSGKLASGDLKDPSLDKVVANFTALLTNDSTLNLTFFIADQKRSHIFLREGKKIVPLQPAAEQLTYDPRLVGNWTHQIITGNNSAGFQTIFFLQITSDGRYDQYSKSVGGSADWSYNSGQAELEQKGVWYSLNNVFYIKAEGQVGYTAAATYRFYDKKLLTEDVSGQKIWTRE